MNQQLKSLISQVRMQCGELKKEHTFATPQEQKKLKGEPYPGCRLKIHFPDHECVDEGYLFTLPGLECDDVWMGGIVHIPHPENPGGKDSCDPEWRTLDELLKLPNCKKIVVVE